MNVISVIYVCVCVFFCLFLAIQLHEHCRRAKGNVLRCCFFNFLNFTLLICLWCCHFIQICSRLQLLLLYERDVWWNISFLCSINAKYENSILVLSEVWINSKRFWENSIFSQHFRRISIYLFSVLLCLSSTHVTIHMHAHTHTNQLIIILCDSVLYSSLWKCTMGQNMIFKCQRNGNQ